MQKLPEIKLLPKSRLNAVKEGLLLCLNCEHPHKESFEGLYLSTDLKDPNINEDIEDSKELASTLESDLILNFYELCRGFEGLWICDGTESLEIAWAVGLGLEIYKNRKNLDLREVLYKYASRSLNIAPRAIWVTSVFDIQLDLQGLLVSVIEEYLATATLVKVGGVQYGTWGLGFK